MPKDSKMFYYAVGKGRQPGVYFSWAECSKQVKGLSNAQFRKFSSLSEAEAFVNHYKNNGTPQKYNKPEMDNSCLTPPSNSVKYIKPETDHSCMIPSNNSVSKSTSADNDDETITYECGQGSIGFRSKRKYHLDQRNLNNENFIRFSEKPNKNIKINLNSPPLTKSVYYNVKCLNNIRKEKQLLVGLSLAEFEKRLKERPNLKMANQLGFDMLLKSLQKSNLDASAKYALELVFKLFQNNPQMVIDNASTSKIEDGATRKINFDENSPQMVAVNTRLDTLEKRFDDCLKQLGASVSELNRVKEDLKELKEEFREYKTQTTSQIEKLTHNPTSENGRSFSHKSASVQNALNEAIEPVPISSDRPVNGEAVKPKKRKRERSRIKIEAEDPQPSTSDTVQPTVKKERPDLATFTVGPDEYVTVYTDGCCLHNGQPNAKAGIGIWFGERHPLNVSKPLDGTSPTNNNAEIQAARVAIELAVEAEIDKLKIHTDSDFLISCATNYMNTWRNNGYRTTSKQRVKNKAELEKLDRVMKQIDVKWEKVEAHCGIKGNEMADKLANDGARFYTIKK